MQKQFRKFLQNTLKFLDAGMLNLSFVGVWLIMHERVGAAGYRPYLEYLFALNVFWVALSFFTLLYSDGIILNFEQFTKRTVQVFLLWTIAMLFYLFFSRQLDVSRLFIFSGTLVFGMNLLINRFIYVGISNYFRSRNHLYNRVLILGYNDTAKKLDEYFSEQGINTRVVGFVETESKVLELTRHPVFTDFDRAIDNAIDLEVQEIYSTITPEQDKHIYTLMQKAEMECIRFKIVPDLSVFINQPVVINYVGPLPVLSLRSEPLDDVGNRLKKRVFDFIISLLVVIFILSWLIPILSLLILIESRGPIFFKQLRTGKNNKTFYCYKFRSMRINSESDRKQATRNDSRITRIGRILRKTSLDEFPQFINVLRGEMSIVGPRPHMVKHTSDYSKLVDQYMIRQFLKPGITGWAQVNGYRGEITDTEQIRNRVQYDLWYLENWSVWLDIRIMFLTVYNVFRGEQNAF